MKALIVSLILSGVLISLGCTSMRVQKEWEKRIANQEFQNERLTFKERLGGKEICWTTGIIEFVWNTEVPSKSCLFPSGRYLYTSNGPGQYPKLLKVMQSIQQGFIIQGTGERCSGSFCHNFTSPSLIFIYKTDEQDIVDGAYLDEKNDGSFYEYAGPFVYQTALGSKTVHTFRKVPQEKVEKAVVGLKNYRPSYELLAKLGMWSDLEKAIRANELDK